MSTQTALLVGILLLATNAFFVAGEFALVAARRTKIEPRAATSRLARTTLGAMDNVSQVMAAVQLGITVASLALGAIAEPAISHVLEPAFDALHVPHGAVHPISFAIALAGVTYLHVVLGEMVPKNIALAGPERAALVLGPPMVAFVTVFKPIVWFLNGVADAFVRLVRLEPASAVASTFTKAEVEALVDESHQGGMIEEAEYERLSGALGFTGREITSVLLPLDRLQTVPRDARVRDVEKICAQTGYSRFPVEQDGRLIGYLHVKDVLAPDPHGRTRVIDDGWIRPFATVPATATLPEALAAMQGGDQIKAHMALVTDAAGPESGPETGPDTDTVLGAITLEDVIEELVGEIRDASHAESSAG